MVNGAAAIAAQHAGSMSIIDHHDGSVFLGQITKLGQRSVSPSMEKTPSEISNFRPG